MNRRRDIERTLDAWLVDGPSVMPDRLFDAVLDRVERTPQRRFARLHLRLTEMNPRIRVYTLAAAGLVVALVGVYLFGRTSPNVNVGASASPSVTTAPTVSRLPPTLLPAELRQTWMGGPRGIPGLDTDAGVTLVFDDAGNFWMTQANLSNQHVLESRVEVLGSGDRFRLRTASGDAICGSTDGGAYGWTLSESGETLEVGVEGDSCEPRLAAVVGTYWRMNCPTAEDNCLGPVEAGTYSSQFLDPYVGPGETWTPRYGALTYTVPDGWVNVEDFPGFFRLAPKDAAPGTGVLIATDVVLSERGDHCSESQDADAGTGAQAMTLGLERAGLLVRTPDPVVIGGLTGYGMDVSLDPAWAEVCPFSSNLPHQELFTDRNAASGFGWGLQADNHALVYLIEVAENRTILITVEGATAADYNAFRDAGVGVVDSFQFNP